MTSSVEWETTTQARRVRAAGPRTAVQKMWDQHVVAELDDGSSLLYIDRVLLHERSGGVALRSLADEGRAIFDSRLAFGTMDHVIDTRPGRTDFTPVPRGDMYIRGFRDEAQRRGISLFDIGDPRQGITHVTFPELGIALPGTTIVCGDSHTGTQGGVGALAWGVGSSEVEHALATQTLVRHRPHQMLVTFDGRPGPGVYAKDLILALIAQIGADGGTGYAIEFAGSAIETMGVEARMTLCNMTVECGAWTGLVAPDATLLRYVAERPFAPAQDDWAAAARSWLELRSDTDAVYDQRVVVVVDGLEPQVTWGTSPEHTVGIGAVVPDPESLADPVAARNALAYVGLQPGYRLDAVPVEAAYIGACTNARLSDLQTAASVLAGRHVAPGIRAICVPGSSAVRRAAEAEGLDQIFLAAGFEWRESGCGFCFYAGGDGFEPGSRVVSTTNRNFENRQGPGVRTHLGSPALVAASAIAGHLADPREVL